MPSTPARIEAPRLQQLLHLPLLVLAQRPVAPRPALRKVRRPHDPVAQVADGDHVGIGGVVAFDDVEVVEDHEGRPLCPRRQQDRGAGRNRPPAGHRCRARPGPSSADRLLHPDAGLRIGKAAAAAPPRPPRAGRASSHASPGRPRSRRARRSDRRTTGSLPVAVEILRIGQEGRGHELRVPQRPGPRAVEILRRHVALLQDLQRIDQLALEEAAAAALVGQRRQRLHHAGSMPRKLP